MGRDLQRWANAADAEERSGRDADLGPLHRFCALQRAFYTTHRVNLAHPSVGAVANAFLRRRDHPGLRRAMAEIVSRELATAGLREAGHNHQRLLRNAQRS